MKKNLSFLLCAFLIGYNTSAQLFTFTFAGTGACPTQGNSVTTANATVTPFARVGPLTCSSAAGYFSTATWNQTSTIDLTQYIEVSITANTGYKLDLQSVSFNLISSSTGPVNARIAHDGGTGNFANYTNYTVSSTPNPNWDFTDFSTGAAGTVKFRIFGWGATGSTGTLKIANFSVFGAVSLVGGGGGSSSQWSNAGSNIYYATGAVGIGNNSPNANAMLDVTGSVYSNKIFVGTSDANTLANIGSNNLLAVNGTAVFVKAKVAVYGSTWPDYVFAPDYKLTPLDSLEQFIQLNKHLPGIPAADDVQKDGIDLGNTQALLLKKIEELTLIVINQNKRQEQTQKIIIEQNAKIEKLNEIVKAKKAQIVFPIF